MAPRPEITAPLATVAPGDTLEIGGMVGEYKIERWLGAGGMGVVYGARHPIIGKRAALKVLNARFSADPQAVARFVQEAQAVNQIGHANIVDIFAFGTLPDGRAYFVMEWLVGESLQDRLERGRVPLVDVLPILIAIARALEAVHAANVVHRDLKPDNVYLVADADGLRIKLLDFGIAKLSSDAAVANRTATGMVMGTPLFMSPEQARGEHIDDRTDIYSLGVMAYHMVCGETPFGREPSAVEVLSAHICKPPPMPTALAPETPPALEALIIEMLAKRPADRPKLADVRRRLSAIAAQAAIATVALPPPPSVAPAPISEANPLLQSDAFAARAVSLPAIPVARKSTRTLAWVGASAAAVIGVVAFLAVSQSSSDASPLPVVAPVVAPPTDPAPPPARAAAKPAVAAKPAKAPKPVPARSNFGTAELAIEPSAAKVEIDGRDIALTDGRLQVELSIGEHDLVVTASGRKAVRQTFVVTADQTTALSLHLERKPETARRGPAANVDGVLNPFASRRR